MKRVFLSYLAAVLATIMMTTVLPFSTVAFAADASTSTQVKTATTMYITKTCYSYKTKSTKSEKIKKLLKGAAIKVIGEAKSYYELEDGSYVLKANVGAKRVNWTNSNYKKPIIRYVLKDNAKTRSSALANGKVVDTLEKGTKLLVVAKTNSGFFKLDDGSYIKASSVTKNKPALQETDPLEFMYYVEDGKMIITEYFGMDEKLVVPSKIDGYPVTEVFINSGCVKTVIIPEGVITCNLSRCADLRNVDLPDSVKSFTLGRCPKLERIVIPDGVETIDSTAFIGCENLTSITLPDSVKTIELCAFSDCKNLVNVNLSENLQKIGDNAFECCEALKTITIPDSVKTIGLYAFKNCKDLKKVDLPSSMEEIGAFAFYGCENLKEITIPDGIKSVEVQTFAYCYALEKVTPPEGLTHIKNHAFISCKNLKSITLPDSMQYIERYNDAFEFVHFGFEYIYKGKVYTNKQILDKILSKNKPSYY